MKNSFSENIGNVPFFRTAMRPPPFLPNIHKPLILNFYPPLIGTFRILGKKGGACLQRGRRM